MTVKITHVGQELWYKPNRGFGRSIKVKTIGRKWVAFDGLKNRVEIDTGNIDGNGWSAPGALYSTKEEYYDSVKRLELIYRFEKAVCAYQTLAKVQTENIIAAAALLGISLEAV